MSDFPNTSAGFREFFHTMRDQIHGTIRSLMEKLGGKVCFRMYHDCDLTDIRYDLDWKQSMKEYLAE